MLKTAGSLSTLSTPLLPAIRAFTAVRRSCCHGGIKPNKFSQWMPGAALFVCLRRTWCCISLKSHARAGFVILLLLSVSAVSAGADRGGHDSVTGPEGCRACKPYAGREQSAQQVPDAQERGVQHERQVLLEEGFTLAIPDGWVLVRRSQPMGITAIFQGR